MCEVYCPQRLADASSSRLKPTNTCVRCVLSHKTGYASSKRLKPTSTCIRCIAPKILSDASSSRLKPTNTHVRCTIPQDGLISHKMGYVSSQRLKPTNTCVRCTTPQDGLCLIQQAETNKYMCEVYYPTRRAMSHQKG